MAVYLLHFDRPVAEGRPAQHYMGFADGGEDAVQRRLRRHLEKRGSRLVAAAVKRGIEVRLAFVWPEGDRDFERRLKNRKESKVFCPICTPKAAERKWPRST